MIRNRVRRTRTGHRIFDHNYDSSSLVLDDLVTNSDKESGWLHLKIVESDDRTADSEMTMMETKWANGEQSNVPVTRYIKGFPNRVGSPCGQDTCPEVEINPDFPFGSTSGLKNDGHQNKFGALYRWNMGEGQGCCGWV